MKLKQVLLKGDVEFKVGTLLKVSGELENVKVNNDQEDSEIVNALDMLDSLYNEWSGIPVVYMKEFNILNQKDLVTNSLKQGCVLKDSRQKLLKVLGNVFLGDEIAAEFLMIHVLSRMYISKLNS